MKFKRIAVLLLALAITAFSALPAMAHSHQGKFTDVSGHWAENCITQWQEHNIVSGDGQSGKFRPNDTITRAEMAAMLNKLIGYQETCDLNFDDVRHGAWYEEDMAKLNKAGVILGNSGHMRPLDCITRAEAAVMIARAMGIEEIDKATNFTDNAAIGSWAKGYVAALYRLGAIEGIDGKFCPTTKITRAEVVAILSRLSADIVDEAGVFSQDVDGNLLVTADGAKLKNMTVNGDLIVTEGVGDGDVSIEKVTVKGDIILRGCGANSFHILTDCNVGKIIVTKTTLGTIRVVNEMGESLPLVYVHDGVGGVVLEGNIDQVLVDADIKLHLKNAKIGTISMSSSGATVNIAKGVTVNQFDVTQEGSGTKINNQGTITKFTTDASGVIIDGNKPGKVTTGKGATKPTTSSGITVSGGSSSGGGSSSAGGSSSGGASSSGGSSSSGGGSSSNDNTKVNAIELQILPAAFGERPDTADIKGIGYSATTEWFNADGTAASYRYRASADEPYTFTADQAYKAVITVTAMTGYEFADNATVSVTDGKNNPTAYTPDSVTGDKQTKTITMVYAATEHKNAMKELQISVPGGVIIGKDYTLTAYCVEDNRLVDPATYTYQWYTCDINGNNLTPISGATQKTYTATASNNITTLYFVCKCVAVGKDFTSKPLSMQIEPEITDVEITPATISLDSYGYGLKDYPTSYGMYTASNDADFCAILNLCNMTSNASVSYEIVLEGYEANATTRTFSTITTISNAQSATVPMEYSFHSFMYLTRDTATLTKAVCTVTPKYKGTRLPSKASTFTLDITPEKQMTWHVYQCLSKYDVDSLSGNQQKYCPEDYSITITKMPDEYNYRDGEAILEMELPYCDNAPDSMCGLFQINAMSNSFESMGDGSSSSTGTIEREYSATFTNSGLGTKAAYNLPFYWFGTKDITEADYLLSSVDVIAVKGKEAFGYCLSYKGHIEIKVDNQ